MAREELRGHKKVPPPKRAAEPIFAESQKRLLAEELNGANHLAVLFYVQYVNTLLVESELCLSTGIELLSGRSYELTGSVVNVDAVVTCLGQFYEELAVHSVSIQLSACCVLDTFGNTYLDNAESLLVLTK